MESSNYKSKEVRNEKNDWNRKVGFEYVLLLFRNRNRRKKWLMNHSLYF